MAAADIKIPNGFSQDILQTRVIGLLALQKPDNYSEMVKEFPDLWRDFYIASMEAGGSMKETTNRFFDQWVDDNKPYEAFKITADVTGAGAGDDVTVTLTAASHLGTGGVLSPPARAHIYVDASTGIEYLVISSNKGTGNAHTAVLRPTSASDTATLTAAASFLKWVGRVSVNEASTQEEGMYRSPEKRRRWLSPIRTDKKYSDYATMEVTDYKGMTLYDMDKSDMNRRHLMSTEYQLMRGLQRDNIDTAFSSNTDAEGLLPQVERWGSNLGTNLTIDDNFFKNITRIASSNGYVRDYTILGEREVGYEIQDYLAAKLGYTGAVMYGDYDGKTEIDVAFNFGKFDLYNTPFRFKEYVLFDPARTHGFDYEATHDDTGRFLIIPNGTVTHSDDTTSNYLTVRYQSFGGQINHIGTDGSFFGKNTENVAEISVTSYKGLETYAIKSYFTGKVTV